MRHGFQRGRPSAGLHRLMLACAVVLVAVTPSTALSPRTGDFAFTAAVGVNRATSNDFETRADGSLSIDFHWSSRNSLRGTMGFLDLPARGDGESVSSLYVTGNVSHNWFGRGLFPYVTGGVGFYAVEEATGLRSDRDHLEVGINGGAGVEARISATLTLRLEAALHAITGEGPSTVAVGSVGLKFYY